MSVCLVQVLSGPGFFYFSPFCFLVSVSFAFASFCFSVSVSSFAFAWGKAVIELNTLRQVLAALDCSRFFLTSGRFFLEDSFRIQSCFNAYAADKRFSSWTFISCRTKSFAWSDTASHSGGENW